MSLGYNEQNLSVRVCELVLQLVSQQTYIKQLLLYSPELHAGTQRGNKAPLFLYTEASQSVICLQPYRVSISLQHVTSLLRNY